jgi:ketosteroid isomerase-like protein
MTTLEVTAAEIDRLVREQFSIIETGDLALADANVTADYVNHRAGHEPMAARGRGPEALKTTAVWLRHAFSELRFDVHHIAVSGDRAAAWVTLHGRNTGPFVVHDAPDGSITQVFPPTGRPFAVRQVHWFRIAGDAIAEHDAVRDDLDMAKQAGWIPPTPAYIIKMRSARRRARKAQAA